MSRLCVVSGVFGNRLRGVFMSQFSKGFHFISENLLKTENLIGVKPDDGRFWPKHVVS